MYECYNYTRNLYIFIFAISFISFCRLYLGIIKDYKYLMKCVLFAKAWSDYKVDMLLYISRLLKLNAKSKGEENEDNANKKKGRH